jgi:hypothetical protein
MKRITEAKWIGILPAVFFLIIALNSHAAVPQTINYQGYLTDTAGQPVTDTVSISFSLYDDETGGSALWTETQSVNVSNGVYSVSLGSVNPVALPFNAQYYLGITIDADPEMIPRQALTSTAYALRTRDTYTQAEMDALLAAQAVNIKNTISPRARVLNSGQLITYNEGDDGNFKYGATVTGSRFTDNLNGTVTDNLTGLIWLKDANCYGAQTWGVANGLAHQMRLGDCGLSDDYTEGAWRLPNRNELMTVVDYARSTPALPTGHPFSNVQSSFYWSSTTFASYSTVAWTVKIEDGAVTPLDKDDVGEVVYMWPVLGEGAKIGVPKTGETTSYGEGSDGALQKGVAWPTPRFTDNGNGTVTDNMTGLIWLQNANCTEYAGGVAKDDGLIDWWSALKWSNNIANGACGLTDGSTAGDWRLPSLNEFKSLIDVSKLAPPSLPVDHPFSNVQSSFYWSSTSCAPVTTNAFVFDMSYGYLVPYYKAWDSYVWPVRGGQ